MTPRTPISTITREQYYQLLGLVLIAKQHNDALEGVTKAVRSITQETDEYGHSSDVLYSDYGVDGLLERLKITVEDPKS